MGLWGRSCIACTYVSVSVELWFGFFFPPVKKIINPSRSPTLSSHFGCCFLHRENKEFLVGITVLPPLPLNRTNSELVDVALTLFESRDDPGQSHQHQDGPRPL